MRDLLARLRGWMFTVRCRIAGKNIAIGPGLKIYKRLKISGKGSIAIGRNCVVSGVRGDSGQYVCLDTLSPAAVLRIGDNASLYAARLAAKFEIVIGDDVVIEEAGVTDTDFHSIAKDRETPTNETKDKCRIAVGNRVCLCSRSSVWKGTVIGDDVIVAPGSIVTMSVAAGNTVAGNPAKILVRK